METFSALLAICAGNLPVTDEFPAQRPVTRKMVPLDDVIMVKKQRIVRLVIWDAIAPIVTPVLC